LRSQPGELLPKVWAMDRGTFCESLHEWVQLLPPIEDNIKPIGHYRAVVSGEVWTGNDNVSVPRLDRVAVALRPRKASGTAHA
jgi:hypothetical protein